MKTFKIICAILLTAGNVASIIMCWGVLTASYTPRLMIGLSLGCSVLALVNIRARMLRAVTYFTASAGLIIGLFYTIYCRRPLGFWVAISACIVITIYFLSESGLKSRKDNFVTKMTAVIALVTVFVFTIFSVTFVLASKNSGIVNGPETMWDSESQAVFDEICADAATDKEVAFAAYNWILNNCTYDNDYEPVFQCFNVKRTLSLKSGICYDFANLFAAICRSQGVPCYCLDGIKKTDTEMQHSWNRVFFDGTWWNLDLSYDVARHNRSPELSLYGFHTCKSMYSPDDDFIITKTY